MNTTYKTLSIAAALAASLGLAGCAASSGSGTGMPMDHGSPGAMSTTMPGAGSTPSAGADHNQADVMFAQMMIPHHSQAVEMSDIILGKPDIDPRVTDLADQISAAQGPEIDQMQSWLKQWGNPPMGGDHGGMAGMVSDADMAALRDAQGVEAARLFLTHMIAHHEGAIDMAQEEVNDGRFEDAVQMARTIVITQEQEIKDMQKILDSL